MKNLLIWALFFMTSSGFCQTVVSDNFNNNTLGAGWVGNASYALTETNQELNVNATVVNGSWANFSFSFPAINITTNPYVTLRMKSNLAVNVRIDLVDNAGNSTNASAVSNTVSSNTYSDFVFDFTGRFSQLFPVAAQVNSNAISSIRIFFAPGAAFSGMVQFDNLQIGSNTNTQPTQNNNIRINQLGFYPEAPKTAIGVGSSGNIFYVVSEDRQNTLYTGNLSNEATWAPTGESVKKAYFSSFKTPGKYAILIPGLGYSSTFEIKPEVNRNVSLALMKAFYFQRASMALTTPYAGIYAREMGHPDRNVIIHNSAASPGRPTGSTINSSKGWYDAGDYNKYVVNSGISTYNLLHLYETFSGHMDTLKLNIPESSNTIPDILDESLWNIRWMLTMQDPYDGGVYHKLTNSYFDGDVMPAAATSPRYVVQKSTAATLNFTAIMAQSARIFSKFPNALPGLADSCINAAYRGWLWARRNPNVFYNQDQLSNPIITTGVYGDNSLFDEFRWAGFELYTTTKIDSFYTSRGNVSTIGVPSWGYVDALGYYTLAQYRKQLTPACDTQAVKNRVIALANNLRTEALTNSAYGVSMTNGTLNWGSTGTAADMGVTLLLAFGITGDSTYYRAAIAQMDYLLGRNGTNYSFVTGYGVLTPRNIHHRPSVADGIPGAIPGFLAGGPPTDAQNDCGAASYPSTTLKGRAYLDAYCSYSTNEVTINWNAPAAFLAAGLEAVNKRIKSSAFSFNRVLPSVLVTNLEEEGERETIIKVYPNPVVNKINIENEKEGIIQISDLTGVVLVNNEGHKGLNTIDISSLPEGMYIISFFSDGQKKIEKFIKQ